MLETGILLNVTADHHSIYEKRGMLTFGYAHGPDGWTSSPAAAPALARPVRLPRGYSGARHTASASAPAAMSATEKERALRWLHDREKGNGQGGQKPQLGWFLEV